MIPLMIPLAAKQIILELFVIYPTVFALCWKPCKLSLHL